MLFDKDGIYEFSIPNVFEVTATDDNAGLYEPKKALSIGNTFKGLYEPYKSYTPSMIKPNSEREKLRNEIIALMLTINDLNLYLDLNPEDEYVYDLFKNFTEEKIEKEKDYTSIYGPIMLNNLTDKYDWTNNAFPWEEDKDV